jgi:hypothetical protein
MRRDALVQQITRAALEHIRKEGSVVKFTRRFLLSAAMVATIASAVVCFGIGAAPAFAATAKDKQDSFEWCWSGSQKTAADFVSCCRFAGGAVQIEYDSSGNIVSASCLIHSDLSTTPQRQPLLSTYVGDLFVPATNGGHYLIRLGLGLTGPPVVYIPPPEPIV